MVQDNQITLTIGDVDAAIAAGYTDVYIYEDTDSGGAFTTQDLSITLVANTTEYTVYDIDGTASTYYKATLYGAALTPTDTAKSDYLQSGTFADNVYCSSFDIRQGMATGGTGTSASNAKFGHVIWEDIIRASRLIDRMKRVPDGAYRATTSTDMYYYGSGNSVQPIDNFASISAVAVDEMASGSYTAWVAGDYDTWPYNHTALGESIRRLDINDTSGTTKSIFTKGARRVKVTGVPGISTTPPPDIVRACQIQVTRWYKRTQQAWQDASANADLGQVLFVRNLDPDVQTIINYAFPHTGGGI
jgi:hypothetical protein